MWQQHVSMICYWLAAVKHKEFQMLIQSSSSSSSSSHSFQHRWMCVSISILISVAPSIHSVQQIGESHIFFDYLIFIVVAHYYNVLRPVRDCIQLRNGQQHILLCNGVLHEPNQSFSTRYGYTYTIGVLRVSLQRKTGKWHVRWCNAADYIFFSATWCSYEHIKVKGISIKRCNNKSSEKGIQISPLLLFESHL